MTPLVEKQAENPAGEMQSPGGEKRRAHSR